MADRHFALVQFMPQVPPLLTTSHHKPRLEHSSTNTLPQTSTTFPFSRMEIPQSSLERNSAVTHLLVTELQESEPWIHSSQCCREPQTQLGHGDEDT